MAMGIFRLRSFWLSRPLKSSPSVRPSATAPVPTAALTV